MTDMKKLILPILLSLGTTATANECVLLIHGLGRSSLSMVAMATILQAEGYATHRIDYPSRTEDFPTLASDLSEEISELCAGYDRVHFVTHSMGGILLRYIAAKYPKTLQKNIGHTVMLGPPNKGSEIVDAFGDQIWFKMTNGEAGVSLSTAPDSIPNSLGAFPHSLGVIAGDRSIEPYWAGLFEGENDGKVSVESTRLEGMNDHIVISVTHTFMMQSPKVMEQVLHFLKNGKFDHQN